MQAASEPSAEGEDPRTDLSKQLGGPSAPVASTQNEEEEGDDERIDLKLIQSFASKIQHAPVDGQSRPKINIPKRGEKDFEPLQETVNLQEMMLQNSRQALFDALVGVRGGSSKSMSHALLVPPSSYARLLVSRGHVLDSMGISVRPAIDNQDKKGKGRSRVDLLPEETLYLVERGSLQLWVGREPETAEEVASGFGAWSEEDQGVRGAIEMSVLESFAAFMGKDALTWERYQAYAYLKRLGYTVQRSRRFIPRHFLANTAPSADPSARTQLSICDWVMGISRWFGSIGRLCVSGLTSVLGIWSQTSYASKFAGLRFIPSGHPPIVPGKLLAESSDVESYIALDKNPYLPFFNVWKPATPWSKSKWDLGSEAGLARQRPEYIVAVVESRETPMPTQRQLAEVFDQLPDEPKGIVKRVGPQYQKPPRPSSKPTTKPEKRSLSSIFKWVTSSSTSQPVPVNAAMGALRNGDRALIVAVNDSGNTGWVRFGRSGFVNYPVL